MKTYFHRHGMWMPKQEPPVNGFAYFQHQISLPIKPQGKLRHVHFPGSEDKRYVDERGQVFVIDFRTGEKLFMYHTCKEE